VRPEQDEDTRAWVQARVDEVGSIEAAKPDTVTQRAWRDLCRHLAVTARPRRAANLQEALEEVARLARG